jgi:hypothetical protein
VALGLLMLAAAGCSNETTATDTESATESSTSQAATEATASQSVGAVESVDLAALAAGSAPVLTTNLNEWSTVSATPLATGCPAPPAGDGAVVYFLCGDGPAPARRLASTNPQALLDAWLAGPTPEETSAGFSSAAPAAAEGDVAVVDQVVVVDVLTPVTWVGHHPTGSTLQLTMAQVPDTRAMSLLVQHTPYCVKETLCLP